MKIIIIILFIPLTLLFSQDRSLFNLYEKHIPYQFKIAEGGITKVTENLHENSLIHPDLIYYYLEHLNLRYNKNIENPDSNFFNILASKKNYYKKLKNDFALKQEELIKDKIYSFIQVQQMFPIDDLFMEYDEAKIIETVAAIDTNKQNYYTFIYLSGRTNKYYSDINYSLLVKEQIENKVEYFDEKEDNFYYASKEEQLSFIDEMNKYWYFFDPNVKPFTKLDFNQAELVQEIYKTDYKIREDYRVEAFYFPPVIGPRIGETINFAGEYQPPGTSTDPLLLRKDIELEWGNVFSVLTGYRFKFKNNYSGFAYLDFNIGFSLNKAYVDDSFDELIYSVTGARQGEYVTFNVFLENNNYSSYSLLTKVVLPLFYLNRNFHFKIGLQYELRQNEFEYDFVISEEITVPGNEPTITRDVERRTYTNTDHVLNVITSLNAAFDSYEFILEASFSEKFGVGFGVAYNL